MLGKLIKYEFRASGRLIPLVYLVVGLMMIAGIITSLSKMYVYMSISFVLLFLAGAAAMIITYVVVFLRFHRGCSAAKALSAMTLPVTSTQQPLSEDHCGLLLAGSQRPGYSGVLGGGLLGHPPGTGLQLL